MSRHEVAMRRVLYEIPGMRSAEVRDDWFIGADGQRLPAKVYQAVDPISDPAPIVVILEGYPDAGFEQHVGCPFMEMEWTISMAQLIAASGMTAVTHSNRDPLPDAIALLDRLASTGSKLGIWATSGHAPVALRAMSKVACAVLSNPVVPQDLKTLGPHDPPVFLIRSGNDETPGLNAALDAFTAQAIADDRSLTLVNYPAAPHSFDLFLDGPETRRILQQGLDFLRAHLM